MIFQFHDAEEAAHFLRSIWKSCVLEANVAVVAPEFQSAVWAIEMVRSVTNKTDDYVEICNGTVSLTAITPEKFEDYLFNIVVLIDPLRFRQSEIKRLLVAYAQEHAIFTLFDGHEYEEES